jgi:cytochrome c551
MIMTKRKLAGCVAAFAALSVLAASSSPVQAQEAAATFKTKCAACHGADGKGETAIGKANKVRDLGSPEVQKQTDAELTTIIETGKGKMPGYAKSLKPEQVKELVAYIRSIAKK